MSVEKKVKYFLNFDEREFVVLDLGTKSTKSTERYMTVKMSTSREIFERYGNSLRNSFMLFRSDLILVWDVAKQSRKYSKFPDAFKKASILWKLLPKNITSIYRQTYTDYKSCISRFTEFVPYSGARNNNGERLIQSEENQHTPDIVETTGENIGEGEENTGEIIGENIGEREENTGEIIGEGEEITGENIGGGVGNDEILLQNLALEHFINQMSIYDVNIAPNQMDTYGGNIALNQMGTYGGNIAPNHMSIYDVNMAPNQMCTYGGNMAPNQMGTYGGNMAPNQMDTYGGNMAPNQMGTYDVNMAPNQMGTYGGNMAPNQMSTYGGNMAPNQMGAYGGDIAPGTYDGNMAPNQMGAYDGNMAPRFVNPMDYYLLYEEENEVEEENSYTFENFSTWYPSKWFHCISFGFFS
ncbi:unnamed protein product [Rhizophagus irregularis]|nr:unnamed protein product [Rhizophagus irregularis]